MQTHARAHTHRRQQPHCRIGCKGAAGTHFKLGHRELFSYPAPLKPCSAEASHESLRLRLIGLGKTEPPPSDGAGRPRGNACAFGIRDRSSRCVYAEGTRLATVYAMNVCTRHVFASAAGLGCEKPVVVSVSVRRYSCGKGPQPHAHGAKVKLDVPRGLRDQSGRGRR